MSSRRLLKAAEAIREIVSLAILAEVRDPRVQHVTVTGVEVAPDMRSAKVKVSVMGSPGQQHLCLDGLQQAAGFLQHKLGRELQTRYTPKLEFQLDQGVKQSAQITEILRRVLPPPSAEDGGDGTEVVADQEVAALDSVSEHEAQEGES